MTSATAPLPWITLGMPGYLALMVPSASEAQLTRNLPPTGAGRNAGHYYREGGFCFAPGGSVTSNRGAVRPGEAAARGRSIPPVQRDREIAARTRVIGNQRVADDPAAHVAPLDVVRAGAG